MESNKILRNIPKIDSILQESKWKDLILIYPESLAKDALRQCIDDIRTGILEGTITDIPLVHDIIDQARVFLKHIADPRLRRVINGTGIIIHTNLGRALIAKSAMESMMNAAGYYTNLEYDITAGRRGDRFLHCVEILRKLTGAEDAMVVNNNAAAVFLVLNTFAEHKEVIISRGELIEIGGSFRIPDVMKKSGALLREVGTTNRTHIDDYESSIREDTALLMKVHTSNYRIRGFTHAVEGKEITGLGRKYNILTYHDAGSGLFFPLPGLNMHDEPVIPAEVAKGYDIVSFSGDKLLGAPQAGVIVGSSELIKAMKKNPLTRAVRPDKFTLAGLERTLLIYTDEQTAKKEIPVLRMIFEKREVLKKRAKRMEKALQSLSPDLTVTTTGVFSEVGGGTLPDVPIPSFGIAMKPARMSINDFEEGLRGLHVPIIGRVERETFFIDMRTILPDDEPLLVSGIERVIKNGA